MKLRWMFCCIVIGCCNLAPAGDAKKVGLGGKWEGELGGKKIQMVFEVDKKPQAFAITLDDKKFEGTFKTEPSKSPAHMDLTVTKGEKFQDKTALAIFELKDDTLRWAANQPGEADRPTEFPNQEGDGKILYVVFKRAK